MTDTDSSGLLGRLAGREARVGIIGLGYVGLSLAIELTDAGFSVHGYDIDTDRVERLQEGDSYVDDITNSALQEALTRGFTPADQPENVESCDAYIIAVPTTVKQGKPQLGAVRDASLTIGEQLDDREALVVVASTVYPGATQEVVKPAVTGQRSSTAAATHLAMVPERIDPGGEYDTAEIPLVVGADTDLARCHAQELFTSIVVETHAVGSTTTAELTKTLENSYRMVNIALVNELAKLSEALGANIWDAIEAADTKPFGFQAFEPGPGVGGHCIPVDPQFLSWQGRKNDEILTTIEQAHQANESMPSHVIDRFQAALAARNLDFWEATILVMGVSYKPDVADVRNSPARVIGEQLATRGATLEVLDPHVESVSLNGDTIEPLDSLSAVDLQAVDAAAVLVDHSSFEYKPLEAVPLVFDSQNAVSESIETAVVSLGKNRRLTQESKKQAAARTDDD